MDDQQLAARLLLCSGNFARLQPLPEGFCDYHVTEFGTETDQSMVRNSMAFNAVTSGNLERLHQLVQENILNNPHPYLVHVAAVNEQKEILDFLVSRVWLQPNDLFFYYKGAALELMKFYGLEEAGLGPMFCQADHLSSRQHEPAVRDLVHQHFSRCFAQVRRLGGDNSGESSGEERNCARRPRDDDDDDDVNRPFARARHA